MLVQYADQVLDSVDGVGHFCFGALDRSIWRGRRTACGRQVSVAGEIEVGAARTTSLTAQLSTYPQAIPTPPPFPPPLLHSF